MLILGLNAYHADSAACVMKDGRLVAAAEEERFRRIKHWAGLPTQAIDYCLSEVGASLSDVDHIAINRKPGANNWRRLPSTNNQVPRTHERPARAQHFLQRKRTARLPAGRSARLFPAHADGCPRPG